MRHRRRRRRGVVSLPLAIGLVAVILVGGVGGGAIFVNHLGDDLQAHLTADIQSGQNELEAGKSTLVKANSQRSETLLDEARSHFVHARKSFAAVSQLADTSAVLGFAQRLPGEDTYVLPRHRAVDSIASMGIALADAGLKLLDLDRQLIQPSTGGQGASSLLATLQQARPIISQVEVDLSRAQLAANAVDLSVLSPSQRATLVRARQTIGKGIQGLSDFDQLVPILVDLLGGNGSRNYLIEQVNPAELRAGGGFFGTYSVLRTDHGKLQLVAGGSVTQLDANRPSLGQPGWVEPPGPFRVLIGDLSWSLRDSNFFPDFPSNAIAGQSFAEKSLGYHLDGIISMDYYAVARFLAVTGPIAVPGFSVTIDSNNFIPTAIQLDIADSPLHKLILGAIAGPLMQKVATLPANQWPALLAGLNDMASQRHLQVYLPSQPGEQQIARFGWSGTLNLATAPDFMMEIEDNMGGTKANYFITRHYTVTLTRSGSTLHHHIMILEQNLTPSQQHYADWYRAYVRLYLLSGARNISYRFPPTIAPTSFRYINVTPGTSLIEGWFQSYARSGANQGYEYMTFDYDTPWTTNAAGQHEIYWQKQPGTVNDKVDVVWQNGGHTFKVGGDLGQDRLITLTPTGVTLTPGQAAQATLPSLSLG